MFQRSVTFTHEINTFRERIGAAVHFCQDEAAAIVGTFPALAFAWYQLKSKFIRKVKMKSAKLAPPQVVVHQIDTDGITVWVNGEGPCLGRFGKFGIDVHSMNNDDTECLHCTHAETTLSDWRVFQEKMKEHYNITVSDKYMPKRFGRYRDNV